MTDTIPLPTDDLVQQCLNHFQKELVALGELNASLRAVQHAIKRHDTEQLPELVDEQQLRSQQLDEVRGRRQQIRSLIANHMNVPSDKATVSDWAATLPAHQQTSVLDQRDRLAKVADETSQLAQANMAVVAHGLQILHEVRNCLTGESGQSDRYLATGQPCAPGPQTLYNTRY